MNEKETKRFKAKRKLECMIYIWCCSYTLHVACILSLCEFSVCVRVSNFMRHIKIDTSQRKSYSTPVINVSHRSGNIETAMCAAHIIIWWLHIFNFIKSCQAFFSGQSLLSDDCRCTKTFRYKFRMPFARLTVFNSELKKQHHLIWFASMEAHSNWTQKQNSYPDKKNDVESAFDLIYFATIERHSTPSHRTSSKYFIRNHEINHDGIVGTTTFTFSVWIVSDAQKRNERVNTRAQSIWYAMKI